jgi:hypothetical protein
MINMLMPVQQKSVIRLRVLLVIKLKEERMDCFTCPVRSTLREEVLSISPLFCCNRIDQVKEENTDCFSSPMRSALHEGVLSIH